MQSILIKILIKTTKSKKASKNFILLFKQNIYIKRNIQKKKIAASILL